MCGWACTEVGTNLSILDVGNRDLSRNSITGEIPESVSSFTRLYQLYAPHSHLIGKLRFLKGAPVINGCRSLAINRLSGVIPTALASLQLQFLYDLSLVSDRLFHSFRQVAGR